MLEVGRETLARAARVDRTRSARGDADGGRRGRVDCFATAQRLTRRPYDSKGHGYVNRGAEKRAGLNA